MLLPDYLTEYAHIFIEQKVEYRDLPLLKMEDLEEMGIPDSPRVHLLNIFQQLGHGGERTRHLPPQEEVAQQREYVLEFDEHVKVAQTLKDESPSRAEAALERALATSPGDDQTFDVLLALADLQEGSGRLEDAAATLGRAVVLRPTDRAVLINLGGVYYSGGNYARAAQLYQRAVGANRSDFDAQYNLGNALLLLGDATGGTEGEMHTTGAVAAFRAALRVAPQHTGALSNLAAALLSRDAGEAEALSRAVLALDPAHTHARLHLARALLRAMRHAEVHGALRGMPAPPPVRMVRMQEEGMESALKPVPHDAATQARVDAYVTGMALLCESKAAMKAALPPLVVALRGALRHSPRHAEALETLSRLHAQSGNASASVDAAQQALTAQPNRVTTLVQMARSLLALHAQGPASALRAHGGAGAVLQRAAEATAGALRRAPTHVAVVVVKAALEKAQVRQQAAVETYKRAYPLALRDSDSGQLLSLCASLDSLNMEEHVLGCHRELVRRHPGQSSLLFGLGNALQARNRYDDAIAVYRQALRIGTAALRQLSEAATEAAAEAEVAAVTSGDSDTTLSLKVEQTRADVAGIWCNLGGALMGKRNGANLRLAADAFQQCSQLLPDSLLCRLNRMVALNMLGEREATIAEAQRVLQQHPDHSRALNCLAMYALQDGDLDEATRIFARSHRLERSLEARAAAPLSAATSSAVHLAVLPHKLKHDIEQFTYLAERGIHSEWLRGSVIPAYRAVLAQLPPVVSADTKPFPLTPEQLQLIGATYNTAVYSPAVPAMDPLVDGPVLNPGLDFAALQRVYLESDPHILVIDALLTPEALRRVRQVCLEATMWFDVKPWGYLGAYINKGLHAPIMLQVSEQIREAMPHIFGRHPLTQMWAYKYDSSMRGINIHGDEAAVNLNLWVTPDSANLHPGSGGLVVYKAPTPPSWSFDEMNTSHRDSVNATIQALLRSDGYRNETVPYRANRCVLFDSKLFHKTDNFAFKRGYTNRRINLTFLYGYRSYAAK